MKDVIRWGIFLSLYLGCIVMYIPSLIPKYLLEGVIMTLRYYCVLLFVDLFHSEYFRHLIEVLFSRNGLTTRKRRGTDFGGPFLCHKQSEPMSHAWYSLVHQYRIRQRDAELVLWNFRTQPPTSSLQLPLKLHCPIGPFALQLRQHPPNPLCP